MKNEPFTKLIFIIGVFIGLLFNATFLFSQVNSNSVLTDQDKIAIIKYLLERKVEGIAKLPKEIVFSTKNIKSKLVPEIEGTKFVFMTPGEILKKSRTIGVKYLQFNTFEIKDSKVTVVLSDNYFRMQYFESRGFRYECYKEVGEWRCELKSRYQAVS